MPGAGKFASTRHPILGLGCWQICQHPRAENQGPLHRTGEDARASIGIRNGA